MIKFQNSVTSYGSQLKDIEKAFDALSKKELLLGVMQEGRTTTKPGKRELTNSEIAFLNEFGAPELAIPERPFLFPVLNENINEIKQALWQAAEFALAGNDADCDRQLHSLGMYLVNKIKERILNFIPPALSPKTIAKRVARGNTDTTPLKDTSNLFNSIGYNVGNR